MEEKVQKSAGRGPSNKTIILILGILLIIGATVVTIVLLMGRKEDDAVIETDPVPFGSYVVDENNIKEIMADLEDKVAKGMFETHMNTTWTFPDGESASTDAIMGNAVSNNYSFYFTVETGGDTVYTSSLLPVGTQIESITLEKDLDAGTYPAILTVHMIEEDGTPVESNVGFNITLIVQS